MIPHRKWGWPEPRSAGSSHVMHVTVVVTPTYLVAILAQSPPASGHVHVDSLRGGVSIELSGLQGLGPVLLRRWREGRVESTAWQPSLLWHFR